MAIGSAQKDRAAKGIAPKGVVYDTTLSEYNYLVINTDDESKKKNIFNTFKKTE